MLAADRWVRLSLGSGLPTGYPHWPLWGREALLNLALDGGGVGALIGSQAFPHVAVIHNGALVAGFSSRAGGKMFPVAAERHGVAG